MRCIDSSVFSQDVLGALDLDAPAQRVGGLGDGHDSIAARRAGVPPPLR